MTDTVQVILGISGGQVELGMRESGSGRFATGAFDPQNAHELGEKLIKAARDARGGLLVLPSEEELAEHRRKVTDERRELMIAMVATQLKSLIEKGRSPGVMAMHAVDAVLQEVAR